MAKCIVIAPLYQGEEAEWLRPEPGDLLICADGGYAAAVRAGLRPDLVIGDFDSMPVENVRDCEIIRLPVHKDDTDMVVCLREGRRRGYTEFRLAGCIGGRIDHTLSNMQCLCDCALRGEAAWMCDDCNRVTILTPGTYTLPNMPGRKFSLLAYTPEVTGVRLRGTLWPLTDAVLTNRWPVGVSNEITADAAVLTFDAGMAIVAFSADATR